MDRFNRSILKCLGGPRRPARLFALFLSVAWLGLGCAPEVFHTPATISTHESATRNAERLGRVTVEKCAMVIVILPFSYDTRDGYDELLAEAARIGGNAVVDLQVRFTDSFAFIPIFQRQCLEYTGVAARL